MSDLSQLVFHDTAKYYVMHPGSGQPFLTDDGEAMFVEVYSSQSDHYDRVVRDLALQENKPAEGFDRATQLIARCVKSWNIQIDDRQPSIDEAETVLADKRLRWLSVRLDRSIHGTALFFEDASPS